VAKQIVGRDEIIATKVFVFESTLNHQQQSSRFNMDDMDSGSYQMAISPVVPDDGLTSEGRPRAIRYKKQLLNELSAEVQLEEHKLTVDELCEQLQTDPEFGLMHSQAKAILERDGPNLIEPEKSKSLLSTGFG
jgi:hypothetical protein